MAKQETCLFPQVIIALQKPYMHLKEGAAGNSLRRKPMQNNLACVVTLFMKPLRFSILFFSQLLVLFSLSTTPTASSGGRWELIKTSIGVSAMHMQLLNNDRVVIFDRTDFGKSNLSLPDGKCRDDANDTALRHDCTAHSAEYDVLSDSVRPLMVLTDTWCSSGTVAANGSLVQTGGFNDGDRAVRTFRPCGNCDWKENRFGLEVRRWYATNQILPDGRAIIIGGRRQFNYEFFPKSDESTSGVFNLPFLRQTSDVDENNLYPFLHLNIDGNLFIFANNRAILLNYQKNVIVMTYPAMPGGDPRNYPSSGSSVLLPLKPSGLEAEILICGGAPRGSFTQAQRGNFIGALNTCGRIRITDPKPSWSMETMPTRRVMGDMILLPNGAEVLLINGASSGTAGWEYARDPVLSPVIYRHDNPLQSRFDVQNQTTIPRLYHSTATLLRDGRVLVGGSNPHSTYKFWGTTYPTELSLEAFSPEYLSADNSNSRPNIISSAGAPAPPMELNYGKRFSLQFTVVGAGGMEREGVSVTMVAPSFVTHYFSMNQRLLILESEKATTVGSSKYEVGVVAPRSSFLAPSGYYMVFVVNDGIPSKGIWVHIQ